MIQENATAALFLNNNLVEMMGLDSVEGNGNAGSSQSVEGNVLRKIRVCLDYLSESFRRIIRVS